MDSFATQQLFKSPSIVSNTSSSFFRNGNIIIISDFVISNYIKTQYPGFPPLPPITVCQSILLPITKVGNLENISTKIWNSQNNKNTNSFAQHIFRKQILKQLKYIVSNINKYWQRIDFDYYDYDIFEITTIPEFYIVERHVKERSHSHKRTPDCDEIARIFIHNDIIFTLF